MRRPPSWIPKAFGTIGLIATAIGMVEPDSRLSKYVLALSGAFNSCALLWVRQDGVTSEQVHAAAARPGKAAP